MTKQSIAACIGLLLAAGGQAQGPSVTPGDLDCLPSESNAPITATFSRGEGDAAAGSGLRLYFRRLHPFGAYYFVEMHPDREADPGAYWTVFPKPERRAQQRLEDAAAEDQWWEVLRERDWMEGRDREWLEGWLEEQEQEAAEYYVALIDHRGRTLERSRTRLAEVREDCEETIVDAVQEGWAQNLTVGETTEVQAGKQVFHWLCDGIVTRLGADEVLRPDGFCRACVVAAIPIAPLAGGLVAVTANERSPSRP